MLDGLKVLFLPRVLVTDPATEAALIRFVERGGTLVCESECGAFDSAGFYRYPEERFLARFGVVETGRRNLEAEAMDFQYNGRSYRLGVEQWMTPPEKEPEGQLCRTVSYGAGRVVYLGSYPGNACGRSWNPEFEALLRDIVTDSGVVPPVVVREPLPGKERFVYLKSGRSQGKSLLFVFFPPDVQEAEIAVGSELFPGNRARELFSGSETELAAGGDGRTMRLKPGRFQLAVYTDALV